ncbi:MAG: hypothetical protein ACRDTZ_04320 [Pseudonocardiaceae bacterium]
MKTDPVTFDPVEIERKVMSQAVVVKTWEVPAHGGKGPVTVTLRMPDVTITDSQGRHIVISPEQADLVSSKMGDIAYWFEDIKEAVGD